jgi:hypothetical protein
VAWKLILFHNRFVNIPLPAESKTAAMVDILRLAEKRNASTLDAES